MAAPAVAKGEDDLGAVSFIEAAPEPAAAAPTAKTKKAAKLPWPKDLPARVVAVRDLLAALGEAAAADVPQKFKGRSGGAGGKAFSKVSPRSAWRSRPRRRRRQRERGRWCGERGAAPPRPFGRLRLPPG